ncbi:subtilisin-like protease SBT4.6 isoform X2 [Humulus lupulus]|nr:subtilisin-like protease SBT4.6 isoform X2 [Humulus lupulus]
MGALQDKLNSPMSQHHGILQSVIDDGSTSVGDALVRSYSRSFNGFAAKLTEKQRLKIEGMKEVISVFPNKILYKQTTRSWDYMGFHKTVRRNPTVESDTIIGVIDSGIWPESKSFSDEGFGPPPKKWKGACNGGENFTCNNKIIGAQHYSTLAGDSSTRDDDGHGSHTASTAAGNNVNHASFYDLKKGEARGGVPSARIAAYKVCNSKMCTAAAVMAAFDDAISDGVDIISISISFTGAVSFAEDPIAIGAFHAMEKGILTTHSAGNLGPSIGTVSSVAPWLMTVAASTTDQRIIDKVVLGNGMTIIGRSINSFKLNGTTFPLVRGEDASSQCSGLFSSICTNGCLDTNLIKGKIVMCDLYSGANEAFKAGALGCITTIDDFNDFSTIVPFPASVLNSTDYFAVLSYLNSTKNPEATILRSEFRKDYAAPTVASFSSRGPNTITPDIMKPDISAPGVNILAAYSPESSPTRVFDDKRRVNYNILSGTSMACPHVAGAAAYVKTFHPDWSPSAIKSSLMTTSWLMSNNTEQPNGEFDYGSGHVNPVQAINPGLVYEALEGDYIDFLCSIGYDDKKVRLISADNSSCPQNSDKGSPKDLNYPSMTAEVAPGKSFSIQFRRRVKNVGQANSTYKATIYSKSLTGIKVVPEVLSFQSLNEEKSYDVIVNGSGLSDNSMVSASLVWSDGIHSVRSPIVVHNLK